MFDRAGIHERLKKIEYCLKVVRALQKTPAADFATDPRVFGAAERFLQIAAQGCIDISLLLLTWRGAEKPGGYADLGVALNKANILIGGAAQVVDPIVHLRNSLVIDYLEVEPAKLYGSLQTILDDIDSYVRALNSFLQKVE